MNAPEGWKLVPVEPTPEMRATFRAEVGSATHFTHTSLLCGDFDSRYRAMLAAVPTPPAQDRRSEAMKREGDCRTLDDWRMRAMELEASWERCSVACARVQGQRDEALELLRRIIFAVDERKAAARNAAKWEAASINYHAALRYARALIAKRGAA